MKVIYLQKNHSKELSSNPELMRKIEEAYKMPPLKVSRINNEWNHPDSPYVGTIIELGAPSGCYPTGLPMNEFQKSHPDKEFWTIEECIGTKMQA